MHSNSTSQYINIKSTKSIVLKIIIVAICVVIFALTLRSKYTYFYKSLHLLTRQEVANIIKSKIDSKNNREINTKYVSHVSYVLSDKEELCKDIKTCDLRDGDILIRRYVTDKTRLLDKTLHPYYTHMAFYIGDGYIVEANGTEENKEDDIIKEKINTSDWYDSEIPSFIILRPTYSKDTLAKIDAELTVIANDSQYIFGIPDTNDSRNANINNVINTNSNKNKKQTYCSYIIYDELITHRIIIDRGTKTNKRFISPDYLFSILMSSTSTEMTGYRF